MGKLIYELITECNVKLFNVIFRILTSRLHNKPAIYDSKVYRVKGLF